MKLNFFSWSFAVIIAFIIAGSWLNSCKSLPVANAIKTEGRQLLVNNQPFFIKGICYHPVPPNKTKRSFDRIEEDLDLMLKAGINTIRVYEPIQEKEVMDLIAEKGLFVIVGFGYNQGGQFDVLSGTYLDYVRSYKNHPAVLLWELGNEYNYHPEWFSGDIKNWYRAMNEAAKAIHAEDPTHPVTTAHGELPDKLALAMGTEIDIWGMNVYRWDKPGPIFDQWKQISSKPMYLSEAGGDSYMTYGSHGYDKGPNQKAQADANANILKAIFARKDIGSGVALFSYTDGWWKAGNPEKQDPGGFAPNSSGVPYDRTANEEYWGIVDLDRKQKETFQVVKKYYTDEID